MLRDRNDATHIYNEEAAQQLVEKILHQYLGVFVSLEQQIRARYGDEVLETVSYTHLAVYKRQSR